VFLLFEASCAQTGVGNGVFTSSDGKIATAAHVTECGSIEVRSVQQPKTSAVVVRRGDYHTGLDLAIISTGKPSPAYVAINPAHATRYFSDVGVDPSHVEVLTYEGAFGNPEPRRIDARLLGEVNFGWMTWKPWWLMSGHAMEGMSGSPVMGADNRLLGLVGGFFSKSNHDVSSDVAQNTTLVVPSGFLSALGEEIPTGSGAASGNPKDAVVEVICHAVKLRSHESGPDQRS